MNKLFALLIATALVSPGVALAETIPGKTEPTTHVKLHKPMHKTHTIRKVADLKPAPKKPAATKTNAASTAVSQLKQHDPDYPWVTPA